MPGMNLANSDTRLIRILNVFFVKVVQNSVESFLRHGGENGGMTAGCLAGY